MPASLTNNTNNDDQMETIVVTSPIKIWGISENKVVDRNKNDNDIKPSDFNISDSKNKNLLLKNPLIDIVEICSKHGCVIKEDDRYTLYLELGASLAFSSIRYHTFKKRKPFILICSEKEYYLGRHQRRKIIGILYWDKAYNKDNNAILDENNKWYIEPFEGYFDKWRDITNENILAAIVLDIHREFPNIDIRLIPVQIQGLLYEATCRDKPSIKPLKNKKQSIISQIDSSLESNKLLDFIISTLLTLLALCMVWLFLI